MTDISDAERMFRGDRDFIVAQEGGVWTFGHVPLQGGVPLGDSGVTIGAGVDLGQMTDAALHGYGVPPEIIERVRPYLGLRREAALRMLDGVPLSLTPEDARALTDRVHDGIIGELARCFERDSGADFFALPAVMQTVVADVAIQYGPNLARRTPRFWGHVTAGDWAGARAELENFNDAYASRRMREACLLDFDRDTMLA